MNKLDNIVKYFSPHLWKQDEPDAHKPLVYDPAFGFENRPLKRIKATEAEMRSCSLERDVRDECAHLHIAYRTCMKTNQPFWWRCNGFVNEIKNCYYEERIHDMKEFEREKRLLARERRLRAQA